MIFSTIVSALHFFKKKILPFGMNVILQTSIIILLPLLSSSMKWMFEEVYLKRNHESKKQTREQSVVFMYLQFNWPCWNFENEKWDILEKKEKSWRPTNTTSKTSLKKYKTTFSVSYYIFWRSNFMHMKVWEHEEKM